MGVFLIVVAGIGVVYIAARFGYLEWRNRERHRRLSPVLAKKTFLFTRADLLFHRLSLPVILSLTKKNLKIIYPVPFVAVRSIPLVAIKSFGMDTFLPWGSPLDKGRVVNVVMKDGKRLDLRITEDVDSWRNWIQSFGFRA